MLNVQRHFTFVNMKRERGNLRQCIIRAEIELCQEENISDNYYHHNIGLCSWIDKLIRGIIYTRKDFHQFTNRFLYSESSLSCNFSHGDFCGYHGTIDQATASWQHVPTDNATIPFPERKSDVCVHIEKILN